VGRDEDGDDQADEDEDGLGEAANQVASDGGLLLL
jgi:hypothetical protein